ncbi:MAG: tail fiber domain-containing protein [Proteobacteria bacterium]|nr:tail fiber domain-containing protein [Pseudomonadota bacterium]
MKPVFGLVVCMLPLLSAAEVVVPIDSVENFVNIRLSPDAKSEIVGRLQQGESTPIVQSIPEWHEVEIAGGATGFISAAWTVVLDEAPAPMAVAEPANGIVEVPVEETSEEPAVVPEAAPAEEVDEATDVAAEPQQEEESATESVAEQGIDESVAAATSGPEPFFEVVPVVIGEPGPQGPPGIMGPPGPQGPPGAATIEGSKNFLMKFTSATIGGNSQIFDDGNYIGIGTTEPKQRLEVNGNIQIHERNSSVAGLIMTQSSGESGYIMHNRASTLTIGAGSVDRITIDRDGNVGFGTSRPVYPIEMASGAYVSAGGVWTNSSSREKKENIARLTPEDALVALANLEPVTFNYKQDNQEQYVGFIAEDVPQLVASSDRTGLSAMDIVAVLTRVVQLQQQQIRELESRLEQRD